MSFNLTVPDSSETVAAKTKNHHIVPDVFVSDDPSAMPVIYSKPCSKYTMDLFEDYIKENRRRSSIIFTIYNRSIQNGQQTELLQCKIDEIAYQRVLEYAQVTELVFWLLGHGTLEAQLPDFSTYNNVHSVHFASHFSYVTPAFEIISQMKSVKKVTFTLDSNQKPCFLEDLDEDYEGFTVPCNSNVTTLEVKVNPIGCDLKLMNRILEILFIRAGQVLTNVRNLNLELPIEDGSLHVLIQIILNGRCNPLAVDQHLDLNIQAYPPVIQCVYQINSSKPCLARAILRRKIKLIPEQSHYEPWDADFLEAHDTVFGLFSNANRRRSQLWLQPPEMTEFQGVRFSPGVRPKTSSSEDVRELLRRFRYASQQYKGLKRSIEYELTAREVKQQNMYECDGTIAVRKYNDAKRLKVMQARYVIDDDKYVI